MILSVNLPSKHQNFSNFFLNITIYTPIITAGKAKFTFYKLSTENVKNKIPDVPLKFQPSRNYFFQAI